MSERRRIHSAGASGGRGGAARPPDETPTEVAVFTLWLRVPRAQRSYVHWILEAHEGLASLTEPDDPDGELVLTAPAEHREEVLKVLGALAAEVPLSLREKPVS
jgi:hypothetical protein